MVAVVEDPVHGQALAHDPPGLGAPAGRPVGVGQVVQHRANVLVRLPAVQLPGQGQGLLQDGLGLLVPALGVAHGALVLERLEVIGVLLAELPLLDGEDAAVQAVRPVELALRPGHLAQVVH
jgi:hypothetical protein